MYLMNLDDRLTKPRYLGPPLFVLLQYLDLIELIHGFCGIEIAICKMNIF